MMKVERGRYAGPGLGVLAGGVKRRRYGCRNQRQLFVVLFVWLYRHAEEMEMDGGWDGVASMRGDAEARVICARVCGFILVQMGEDIETFCKA